MSGGGSPSTTTQNVVSQTQLPAWYSDYLQNVMGQAVGAAKEPYNAYTGPLNAALTPDQQAAYSQVRGLQGAQDGTLDQAQAGYQAAQSPISGGGDTGAAGAGQFEGANIFYDQAGRANSGSAFQPYASQASNSAQSGIAAANPYIQQSTSPTGLAAASPYLAAASGSFPAAAADYMSPYTQQVTDRIAQLGQRNLKENLLPSISDQFVRAGQFGSAQQRDVVGRALRDTNESVLGQQAEALESGYQTAGNLYNADANRYAGLAGTAGGLGTSQQQLLQGAGSTLGNLGLGQANLYAGLGSTAGGLSSADASRQLAAGQGIAGIGQSQIQAAQADAARQMQAQQYSAQNQLQAAQGLQSLGQQQQTMGLQGAAALQSVGQEQQQNAQGNYNTAYGQFQQQQQYPWQQIGNLSNVIQGLPVNQSTNTTSTTQTPQPSGLSQIAGVGLGVSGLANSGLFKAKGGAVKAKTVKYKRAHSYGNTPRRGIAVFEEAA